MDGKGRWMDNVFIERLWRSIKYEKLRLHSYDTVHELRDCVAEWMQLYNHERYHQHLENHTPWSIYQSEAPLESPKVAYPPSTAFFRFRSELLTLRFSNSPLHLKKQRTIPLHTNKLYSVNQRTVH